MITIGLDGNDFSVARNFTPGTRNGSMECLQVRIIDDNALEYNQSFPVKMTTSNSDIVLKRPQTTVIIVDDDGTKNPDHPYIYD